MAARRSGRHGGRAAAVLSSGGGARHCGSLLRGGLFRFGDARRGGHGAPSGAQRARGGSVRRGVRTSARQLVGGGCAQMRDC
jgi:hypothetical protein